MRADARRRFVEASTRLVAPPFVQELRLRLADDLFALWRRLEGVVESGEAPLPYWAFAWAGGLALARHLLDHPRLVRDRRVLEIGAGSGLVAIAAARAGAAEVTATDIDTLAVAAIELNAEANGVCVGALLGDALGGSGDQIDVVLAADLLYEPRLAERLLAYLERARDRGATVLVAEPERAYLPQWLPRERFVAVATYDVPVGQVIEDEDVKRTTIWALGAGG